MNNEKEDLATLVIERHEESRARTRKALAETEYCEEAAIVQWLTEPPREDYEDLRARFEHRLEGVAYETLRNVAGMVKNACSALRDADAETLESIAHAFAELAERGSSERRYGQILDTLEARLAKAKRSPMTEADARQTHWIMCQIDRAFVRDGFACQLQGEINRVAAKRTSTGNRGGRSSKGAPALLVWCLVTLGICSKATAVERVKSASKRRSNRGK